MHGLTVLQKDNPKVPAIALVNSRPAPDAAVSLDVLLFRVRNDASIHSSLMFTRSRRDRMARKYSVTFTTLESL
jgi:hypothetical protein